MHLSFKTVISDFVLISLMFYIILNLYLDFKLFLTFYTPWHLLEIFSLITTAAIKSSHVQLNSSHMYVTTQLQKVFSAMKK